MHSTLVLFIYTENPSWSNEGCNYVFLQMDIRKKRPLQIVLCAGLFTRKMCSFLFLFVERRSKDCVLRLPATQLMRFGSKTSGRRKLIERRPHRKRHKTHNSLPRRWWKDGLGKFFLHSYTHTQWIKILCALCWKRRVKTNYPTLTYFTMTKLQGWWMRCSICCETISIRI